MTIKRASPDAYEQRPLKQAKLSFGQKMPTKKTTTASTSHRASKAARSFATSGQTDKTAASSRDITIPTPPPRAENGFTITEKVGDIFDAPDDTVIIHACNCVGSWGAGIAAAFRERYPKAFDTYQNHCRNSTPDKLIQTALLIPPKDGEPRHWVGCLFTSKKYGRGKDPPRQILDATVPSFHHLVKQMGDIGDEIREMRICQINSGLFAVPWENSKAVIESLELDEGLKIPRDIVVYSLPST
jgi:ADP-ribose 1''-phosphate phosphatase